MWICSRCQTANKDGYIQCVQCSAPRNARRFGAGTPVSTPSVQAVSPERRMQAQEDKEPTGSPRRQASQETTPRVPRTPGRFIRLTGLLLSLLLPLLVLALAVLQFELLYPVITGLFFKPEAPVPAISGSILYGFSVFTALLTALVPGLSLWTLGHLARGIRRR